MNELQAAYEAWRSGEELRSRRRRYKNYTYGRQWLDTVSTSRGPMTEGEEVEKLGGRPMSNNMIRQLVKCITGNFRRRLMEGDSTGDSVAPLPKEMRERNSLDELDCRLLEEFLISGCAVQRVTEEKRMDGTGVWIDNVSPERFFVNRYTDPRGSDIEIVGMLHDYSLRETQMRYGGGDAGRIAEIGRIYRMVAADTSGLAASLGDRCRTEFFEAPRGRCRVIETWMLESRNVVKCHDPLDGNVFTVDGERLVDVEKLNRRRRRAGMAEVKFENRATVRWHCRNFAPNGEILDEYDSPYRHGRHPFVVKLYPLIDGEVHSFVEDVIDQQRYVNRLITLIDHIMSTSAKGVLLFPSERKPTYMSWEEIGEIWAKPGGVIPIRGNSALGEPQQVLTGGDHTGAYKLLDMQLQLFQQISGVSDALQGRSGLGVQGAELYREQVKNSATAILDLLETFNAFRAQRNVRALETAAMKY